MNHLYLILFFCLLGIACQKQNPIKKTKDNYLHVAIPQGSGLAFVAFKHYNVSNDSLHISYQKPSDTSGNYQKLGAYPINKNDLRELEFLLAHTDSLGHHTSGIFIMGWPRFIMNTRYKEKECQGYVANCYREHIFVFIDWLNKVYPKGNVIDYDKYDLMLREQEATLIKENSI